MGFFNFLTGKRSNQLKDYIDKKAVILDVRTDAEYNTSHIPTAIHIPLDELANRIDEIKVLNRPVIAHCAKGIRSAKAAKVLKSNGIDAINGGGMAKVQALF